MNFFNLVFYNNLKLFFDIFRSDSENSLSSEPSSQFLAMSKLPPPFNNGAGKAFKIFPYVVSKLFSTPYLPNKYLNNLIFRDPWWHD